LADSTSAEAFSSELLWHLRRNVFLFEIFRLKIVGFHECFEQLFPWSTRATTEETGEVSVRYRVHVESVELLSDVVERDVDSSFGRDFIKFFGIDILFKLADDAEPFTWATTTASGAKMCVTSEAMAASKAPATSRTASVSVAAHGTMVSVVTKVAHWAVMTVKAEASWRTVMLHMARTEEAATVRALEV